MDDKQLINESIKVADVLAKELSFWKRLFIYACSIFLSILIIFGILAYIYVYNSKTTVLEGNQNAKIGAGNDIQLFTNKLIKYRKPFGMPDFLYWRKIKNWY